ncbi:MAG: hypothetical protein KIPDCIKN_01695 [Haliscomenobacter sp.]|jgi:uncharacterized membrane protein SpoIIM required for sporulation|nr:hypothetical protein [Haliscomenobacter sp.]
MRETQFIRQNAPKWEEFEQVLEGAHRDPDRLNELFVQITDDLSFSRTFYPNRSVRVYLNDLAQRIFLSIYQGPKNRSLAFSGFWLEKLPLAMYAARRDMLIALLVFAGAFLTGALSSAMDPEFPELILGERYMEMTKENIASGDPMAVYKKMGPFDMTLGITANNLFVASLTFIFGILYGIGSLMILASNGIMLGAFQYFFVQEGLFWESFLTIWIHGTLEISAIVIAGGAGLTMGRGLAFPGAYTRAQAFQRAARRGLQILFGITPLIVLAGIFESFLTRHTDTPDWIRGVFILACLAFVVAYFIWYPYYKASRLGSASLAEPEFAAHKPPLPDQAFIRNAGQVFGDLFPFFQRSFPTVLGLSLLAAVLYCFPVFFFGRAVPPATFFRIDYRLFASLEALGQFYHHRNAIPWAPWLNVPILALFSTLLFPRLMGKPPAPWATVLVQFMKALAPAAFMVGILHAQSPYASFIILVFFPLLLLWMAVLALEPEIRGLGMRRALFLALPNFSRIFALLLLLMLTGGLFFSLLDTGLTWTYLNLISWVVRLNSEQMEQFSAVVLAGLTYFFHFLIYGMIVTGFGLMYYSLVEIMEANQLNQRIREIGRKRQIRGLEQETA